MTLYAWLTLEYICVWLAETPFGLYANFAAPPEEIVNQAVLHAAVDTVGTRWGYFGTYPAWVAAKMIPEFYYDNSF